MRTLRCGWRSSVVAALLLMLTGRTAEAGSGGSAYSIYGIGDIRYAPGIRYEGMGGAGLSILGPGYINALSPGAWSRINRTRLEASMLYEGFNATDGTTSRYLARADFDGAALAIPLSQTEGIVFVAGLSPYSSINYDTYTRGNFTSSSDTLDYSIHHVGTGGISRGFAGLSYAPFSTLSLGFSFNYLFGTLEASQTLKPNQTPFTGGLALNRTTVNGVTVSLGGVYTGFGSIAEILKPLSVALVVTSRGTLSSRNQSYYRFTDNEITSERDTSAEATSKTSVPVAYGFGASYQAGERWILAADYFAQPWSESMIGGRTPFSIRNSFRIGFGAERQPPKDPYAPWLSRFALRLGGYYNSSYFMPSGEPINEWGVTAGLSMPFSGETRMAVAASLGSRGTTSQGLIKDTIFRLSVSLNISELWFVRYEDE